MSTHPSTCNDNDVLRLLQQIDSVIHRIVFIQLLTLCKLSSDHNTQQWMVCLVRRIFKEGRRNDTESSQEFLRCNRALSDGLFDKSDLSDFA